MIQTAIVVLLVAAAVGYAFYRLVRTLRGKGGCTGGCDGCPVKGGGECHCRKQL